MTSIEQLHIPFVDGEHPDTAAQVYGAVKHTVELFNPDDPDICMSASLALACGARHIDTTETKQLRNPDYSGRRVVEIANTLGLDVWQMDSQRELFEYLTDDPPCTVAAVVVYVYTPPIAHAVGILRSHVRHDRWYVLNILGNPFIDVLTPGTLEQATAQSRSSVVLRKQE